MHDAKQHVVGMSFCQVRFVCSCGSDPGELQFKFLQGVLAMMLQEPRTFFLLLSLHNVVFTRTTVKETLKLVLKTPLKYVQWELLSYKCSRDSYIDINVVFYCWKDNIIYTGVSEIHALILTRGRTC
jgi:hypothetical protein